MVSLSTNGRVRLVYDGVCNLCAGAVRFLNALDRNHSVDYLPFQKLAPEQRLRYGLKVSELEGQMHLVRLDGAVLKGAVAITEICKLLTPFLLLCDVFNTPLAKWVYGFIARRRYRLFGCRDSCYVPATEVGG